MQEVRLATVATLDALRERLNSALAGAGAAGAWEWDMERKRLHFDSRLAALYGIDPDEAAEGLTTDTFFSAIDPADAPRIRIAVAGMLHGAEVFDKNYRLLAADGSVRWVEAHGRTFYDENERPIGHERSFLPSRLLSRSVPPRSDCIVKSI